jgi:hypothetical protein
MDEVDQQQQKEIHDLQKKDIAHDHALLWMEKAFRFGLWAFIIYVAASSTLIFVLIDKLAGK